jgi:chorismate mutase-like protein
MNVTDWRRKIDAIDTAMLHLLNLRAELAVEIGKMKAQEGAALRVPVREQEILARMKNLNPGPLVDDSVEKIFQLILDQSIRTQELHGCGNAASAKAPPSGTGTARAAARGKRARS